MKVRLYPLDREIYFTKNHLLKSASLLGLAVLSPFLNACGTPATEFDTPASVPTINPEISKYMMDMCIVDGKAKQLETDVSGTTGSFKYYTYLTTEGDIVTYDVTNNSKTLVNPNGSCD